ncbi:MAG: hypothetical protein R3176_01945 [Woeseiaceae bacterium]|nr:hypothetical protein [Woeseiaceae bacterium]
MNSKNVINGLAVLGAIVVMVGVMFAATSALADEPAGAGAPYEAAGGSTAAERSRDAASQAHEAAAAEAAARIAASNRFDLDIRFFDHRSVTIADGR